MISVEGLDSGVEQIVSVLKKKADEKIGPPIALVGGPSSSGKTTLAKRVAELTNGTHISLDMFYGSNSLEEARKRGGNFDHPDLFDFDLAREILSDICEGGKKGEGAKTVSVPFYDFVTGRREGYDEVDVGDAVVFEGLYALFPVFHEFADLKVMVKSSVHELLLRRLMRDAGQSGRTKKSEEAVLDQMLLTVFPMWHEYGKQTERFADIVVCNSYNPLVDGEAGMLRAQAKARFDWDDGLLKELANGSEPRRVRQIDCYLIAPDKDVLDPNDYIRFRIEQDLSQRTHFLYSLAFKSDLPDRPGESRFYGIQNLDFHFLFNLTAPDVGYTFGEIVRKDRSILKTSAIKGVKFAFDHVYLRPAQKFVEIRADSRRQLEQAAGFLGIRDSDLMTKSYLEMALGESSSQQRDASLIR